jgi:hypothetical protein
MEIVILALEFISFIGLILYVRQASLHGERGAPYLRLPIFGAIGVTVLVLSGFQIVSDFVQRVAVLDLWMILYMTLIVTGWTVTFVAIVSSKRAGVVLLSLGDDNQIPWWGVGVIAIGTVVLSYHYLSAEGAYYKTLAMFSAVVFIVFANVTPLLVTERGFYHLDKIADWHAIQAYAWSMRHDNRAVLVLKLKRRWPIFTKTTVYVPAKKKEAVDQLLLQHHAAQPGVQPTRPAAEVGRPF